MSYKVSWYESTGHRDRRDAYRAERAATSRHGFTQRTAKRKCYLTQTVQSVEALLDLLSNRSGVKMVCCLKIHYLD